MKNTLKHTLAHREKQYQATRWYLSKFAAFLQSTEEIDLKSLVLKYRNNLHTFLLMFF